MQCLKQQENFSVVTRLSKMGELVAMYLAFEKRQNIKTDEFLEFSVEIKRINIE